MPRSAAEHLAQVLALVPSRGLHGPPRVAVVRPASGSVALQSAAEEAVVAVRALGALPTMIAYEAARADAVAAAITTARADLALAVTDGAGGLGERVLAEAGVAFVDLALTPASRQGSGRIGAVPVVCLVAEPWGIVVGAEVFVGPVLRALRGVPEPPWAPMRALVPWACPGDAEQVVPVVIEEAGVRPLSSHSPVPDGLARVRAGAPTVAVGDLVAARRFTV